MLGTDCPFLGKECNPGCALYNTFKQECNIVIIAEKLDKVHDELKNIKEKVS